MSIRDVRVVCPKCGNVQMIERERTCWPCHACSIINDICLEKADEMIEEYNNFFNEEEVEDDREED